MSTASVTLHSITVNIVPKVLSVDIENSLYVDDFLKCNRCKNVNIIERKLRLSVN